MGLSDVAALLDDLAEHLEKLQRFASNQRLRMALSDLFDGIETDFAQLIRVSGYIEEVERRFGDSDGIDQHIRCLLCEGDTKKLLELQKLAQGREVNELRILLKSQKAVVEGLNGDTPISQYEEHLLDVAKEADDLYSAAKRTGMKDDVPLSMVPQLASSMDRFVKTKRQIEADELMRTLLGPLYRGMDTDREVLTRTAALARNLYEIELSDHARERFISSGLEVELASRQEASEALSEVLQREELARKSLIDTGWIEERAVMEARGENDYDLGTVGSKLEHALAAREELAQWAAYKKLEVQARSEGLGAILDAYVMAEELVRHLPTAFDYVFSRSILQEEYKRDPELALFLGTQQDVARRRFQELDRKVIELKTKKLATDLSRKDIPQGINFGPRRDWTDVALIMNEIAKNRKHIPLRDLITRARGAIQQMKPCWMMSPGSVAQFLRPGAVEFDIVIIDEASQMRPEEAIASIARGRQLVVVGDPKQLPPTSFFERFDVPEEDDEEAEERIDDESILDRALSAFNPARELRWHYRSRHKSLIAFSNKHFYDGKLLVFPSPVTQHDDYGVQFVKVDGIYTPGAAVNIVEAQQVATAAMDFMNTYPWRSLGIVTVNQAQREVLLEEIERLLARDTKAQEYTDKWESTLEPLFVKNLENVQGDERDVVFISTVYGPNEAGTVMQRFGPINSASGHRRLNVLFTRAREKVVVFSSMMPADIVPSQTSREGVTVLRDYLTYAQTGRLETGIKTDRPPESDFEVMVAECLVRQGYDVVAQVGVYGYFIDLAVKDPKDPNRYILGIECDGAAYHSAKSARDRDRIRQEILEQLGWKLYRIWSTDWFNDPAKEAARLSTYIQTLTSQ